MGAIASYINDYRTTKTIDAIIEETHANLRTRSPILNEIAPTKEYKSRDFLAYITNMVIPEAKIIGFGQEIPVARSGQFARIRADMVKMAISYAYDEETQWKMLEAMKLANLMGTSIEDQIDTAYVGQIVREGSNNDLARQIFGNVSNLVKSIMDKFDALTWEAIQTGGISYSTFGSNIPLSINFLNNASFDTSLHFPAALVATGSPTKKTNRWSDHENADGFQNLIDLHDQYIETNGFSADKIVMSRTLYNNLRQQQTTKDAARSIASVAIGTVSPDMINNVLESHGLPPIQLIDDKWQREDPDTQEKIDTRFIQDNRVTFVKNKMAIRAIGQTLESAVHPVEDGGTVINPKTGIFVETYEEKKSTILDVTRAIMVGLPVVPNAKLLMSQVVN